jgi:O-antigen/teichoic acid export membrane protein
MILISVLARKLDLAKFGLYTLLITVAGVFSIISDFGTSYLMIREVSKDNKKKNIYFTNGTLVKIIINTFLLFLLVVLLKYFFNINYLYTTFLACLASSLLVFVNYYTAFFNAFQKMQYTASLTAVQSSFTSLVCLAIIAYGIYEVNYLFWGHIFVNIIMIAVSIILLTKVLSINLVQFSLDFSLQFSKRSMPFGLFLLGGVIYFYTDTIMLSIMKDKSAVGLYQAPMRLILIIEMIPMLLSTALYPAISKDFINSGQRANLLLGQALKLMLLSGLPVAIAMSICSREIISFLFGGNFMSSIIILQILAWIIPIRFSCHIMGTALSASDKQNLRALASGLCAILNIILNLILIPRYSYSGAAIASLMTNGFLGVFYYQAIKQKTLVLNIEELILPAIAGMTAMGIAIIFLKPFHTLVATILGIVIYVACLILMKGINDSDWQAVKHIFVQKVE